MSPSELIQRCRHCAQQLPPGAIECSRCHTLVHEDDLNRIAAEARSLETKGQLGAARELWLQTLPMLPANSQQAEWIRKHTIELSRQVDAAGAAAENKKKWAKRLGPLGPVAVVLAKAKAFLPLLLKLKFLFSFAAFIGIYWALWGPKFGIGFAVLILIHEMGHFIDVKRRGLPADMPVFLPGLGAYVKWQAMGVSQATRAAISLAGPLAGWCASAVCVFIWWKTANPMWADLARVGAWLNVLNLIPVWILDGGTAASALGRMERLLLLGAGVALWFVLGEKIFLLLSAGAAYRLFTKDLPLEPNRGIAAYYLTVVVILGAVLRVVPGAPLPR